jgi:hypothetical protein
LKKLRAENFCFSLKAYFYRKFKPVKKLLPFIFLFLTISGFCQPANYIGISSGFSLPAGKYADKTYSDFFLNSQAFFSTLTIPPGNPGFAKTGFYISGEGAEYFSDYFGVAAMVSYCRHSFDPTSFNNDIQRSNTLSAGANTGSFTAAPYSNTAIMIGPTVGFNASDKVTFDFRVMIGILTTTYPTQELDVFSNDPYTIDPIVVKFHMDAQSSSSFAFSPGATLRYHIKPGLGLFFKADAIFTEQSFNLSFTTSATYNDPAKNFTQSLPFVMGQPVSIFNLGIGIAYEFK